LVGRCQKDLNIGEGVIKMKKFKVAKKKAVKKKPVKKFRVPKEKMFKDERLDKLVPLIMNAVCRLLSAKGMKKQVQIPLEKAVREIMDEKVKED
jgi:hypothetical protein